jgi:hypothetical protein
MTDIHQFDEIRPYFNNEVKDVLQRIVRERGFLNFVKTFFPEQSTKTIITNLLKVDSIYEFQQQLVYPLVQKIVDFSVTKLSVSGLENIKKDSAHIFLSNHRDIVLDSALLEYILVKNEYPTTQIAIGSNLLILNWIIDLVKLNRSFIVKRDVPHIELYKYSVNLSKYIRFAINELNESLWLAQREGRTKDGDDQTQVAVLKMLNISGDGDFFEKIRQLNIVPLTITYELEPLAINKVQEVYNKMQNPDFKKTKLDDLTSMMKGIETPKGNVHYAFGTPLNELIKSIEHITNRKEQVDALKSLIDKEIYKNYKLSFYNYAAADLYFNTDEYQKYYNDEQKKIFGEYYEKSISKLQGDEKILREMFLKIYAMPVKNQTMGING